MSNKITIKRKFSYIIATSFVLTIVIVCSFLGFIGQSSQIDSEVRSISALDRQLLQLDTEMLQARRSEKDFLLRKDEKYVDRHGLVMTAISEDLTQIRSAVTAAGVPNGDVKVAQISGNLDSYAASFADLVTLMRGIGLSAELGLEGELRKAVHEIETMLAEIGNPELQVKMLMMRRHEKDFMMRVDEKYVTRLDARVREFQAFPASAFGTPRNASRASTLVKAYQSAFTSFAQDTLTQIESRKALSALYADSVPVIAELREAVDVMLAERQAKAERTRAIFLAGTLLAALISLALFTVFARRTSDAIASPLKAYADALSELAEGRAMTSPPTSQIVEIDQISSALAVLRENEQDRQFLQESTASVQQRQEQATEMMRNGLGKLAEGDLSWQMETSIGEEYDQLRQDYNRVVEQLKSVMTTIISRSTR